MKKLIIFVLAFSFPSLANAQTPISKQTANAYFGNCVQAAQKQAQNNPAGAQKLSPASQNMLCACTSAKMMDHFSMEDMQQMTGNDPILARAAYNKMLVELYAPCMETPAYDYYFNTCMQNPDTKKLAHDVKSICQCLGGSMALHLRNNGADVFRKILQANPNVQDPMDALTSDPAFMTFAQQKLTQCLK